MRAVTCFELHTWLQALRLLTVLQGLPSTTRQMVLKPARPVPPMLVLGRYVLDAVFTPDSV